MHSNKNSLTKKEQIEKRKKMLYNEKHIRFTMFPTNFSGKAV